MHSRIKIFIVDDHAVFREGLAFVISKESNLELCGEAQDAREAMAGIEKSNPDLIIVDISLKTDSGIELIKDIKREGYNIPILVLSMHEESLYAHRALKAGAKGYIMKDKSPNEITKAIHQILSGKVYLSKKMTEFLLSSLTLAGSSVKPNISPIDLLSDRELQVFEMIGQGMSTLQIAEKLFLSKKTIGAYRENIKLKLQLNNSAELNRSAFNWFENLE